MAHPDRMDEQAVSDALAKVALLYERIGYAAAARGSRDALEAAMLEAHDARLALVQSARDWATRSYLTGLEEGRASRGRS
jgi:hypothetical protein